MARRTRRYYRRTRPLKTVRYSNETYNATNLFSLSAGTQAHMTLISSVDAQGTRKTKNFTLLFVFAGPVPLVFALVYVPQSQQPSTLMLGAADGPVALYEPNQNVIMSGYITPQSNTAPTFRTRLARNLNSGDRICLVVKAVTDVDINNVGLGIMLNYAISY